MDKAEWSMDGHVFYCDDGAWGIAPDLRTVWLGKKEDVIRKHPVARVRPGVYPKRSTIKIWGQ